MYIIFANEIKQAYKTAASGETQNSN